MSEDKSAAQLERLHDFLPISLWQADQGQVMVDWCHFSDDRLLLPFFAEEVHRQLQRPFNQLLRPQSAIDVLLDRAEQPDCLEPSGFIFHVSRCGSTLLSQMLAQHPRHVVFSEAPIFDQLLELCRAGRIASTLQVPLLRAVARALAVKRQAHWERAWFKLDAWHAEAFPLLQQAFPDAPWICLYRDPLEVMQSHVIQRASYTLPGTGRQPYGMSLVEALEKSDEEFLALKLREIMESMLRFEGHGLYINYQDLPEPGFSRVLQHFGVAPSGAEYDAMRVISLQHAKQPGKPFAADSQTKRSEASALVQHWSETLLQPIFQLLEQRRWRP